MTLSEFEEWLRDQSPDNKIVFMRTRYGFQGDWDYDKEILYITSMWHKNITDPYEVEYEWETDWYEGQDEVEILGCIDVSSVDVPLFEKGEQE